MGYAIKAFLCFEWTEMWSFPELILKTLLVFQAPRKSYIGIIKLMMGKPIRGLFQNRCKCLYLENKLHTQFKQNTLISVIYKKSWDFSQYHYLEFILCNFILRDEFVWNLNLFITNYLLEKELITTYRADKYLSFSIQINDSVDQCPIISHADIRRKLRFVNRVLSDSPGETSSAHLVSS